MAVTLIKHAEGYKEAAAPLSSAQEEIELIKQGAHQHNRGSIIMRWTAPSMEAMLEAAMHDGSTWTDALKKCGFVRGGEERGTGALSPDKLIRAQFAGHLYVLHAIS